MSAKPDYRLKVLNKENNEKCRLDKIIFQLDKVNRLLYLKEKQPRRYYEVP